MDVHHSIKFICIAERFDSMGQIYEKNHQFERFLDVLIPLQ